MPGILFCNIGKPLIIYRNGNNNEQFPLATGYIKSVPYRFYRGNTIGVFFSTHCIKG